MISTQPKCGSCPAMVEQVEGMDSLAVRYECDCPPDPTQTSMLEPTLASTVSSLASSGILLHSSSSRYHKSTGTHSYSLCKPPEKPKLSTVTERSSPSTCRPGNPHQIAEAHWMRRCAMRKTMEIHSSFRAGNSVFQCLAESRNNG